MRSSTPESPFQLSSPLIIYIYYLYWMAVLREYRHQIFSHFLHFFYLLVCPLAGHLRLDELGIPTFTSRLPTSVA